MTPSSTTRLLTLTSFLVVVVGAIDAAWSEEWDLFALLAIATAIQGLLLSRLESKRPAVPIRRDLVVWYRDRAALAAEPMPVVVDRALAAYRDRFGQASANPQVRR